MQKLYPAAGAAVWVDLHNPSKEDVARARTEFQLDIPTREALDEIQTSSRLQATKEALTISIPATPYHEGREPVTAPVGFVLTPKLLVTVRFDDLVTFRQVAETLIKEEEARSSAQVLSAILEAIVDSSADHLEGCKAITRSLSRVIFHRAAAPRRNVARKSRLLRETLVRIGDLEESLSHTRETLLAIQRAIPFIAEHGKEWIGADVQARLHTAARDIQSLNDFEVHLTDKVQFLLDATLGFINTEQNDIFKVLTIASVVGIPPTFFASMYGMNFHNMPEYAWAYGYQWGLFLIILSTILPIAWFKWRGWW
ncbi:MAG TPA: magnesium transporter CorA family protein [Rhizomicrobium sp.]|nr:magnesium transporter CorA family protein [Rhizomicrobium sp.]